MSETKPIYSGEATLRARGETDKAGRWIRLEIEDFGGVHPFKGYEGERFGVVIVGPLASAEHEIPSPLDKRGVSAGGGVGRDGETQGSPATPTKPKRRWQDMPASQRAALLTKDPLFWEYLRHCGDPDCNGENHADELLKAECNIKSKAELDRGDPSIFLDIEDGFKVWKQARGHGVI